MTDHFLTFLRTDSSSSTTKTPTNSVIYKRTFNEHSIFQFRNLLSQLDWELVIQSEDANSAYELFLKYFYTQYENFLQNSVYFVLFIFRDSLFALNHSLILLSSLFTVVKSVLISL